METKLLPIDDLKMADYNPRKDLRPGDEEYEKLRTSIQEFGYVSPVIVNKNNNVVIGGHQRYKILKELGHENIMCVLVDVNQQQEKMLNLALNKIQGDWDMEKLEEIMKEFQEEGYDATITGFSTEEIDNLVGNFDPLADENDSDSAADSIDVDTMVTCPKCQYLAPKDDFKI